MSVAAQEKLILKIKNHIRMLEEDADHINMTIQASENLTQALILDLHKSEALSTALQQLEAGLELQKKENSCACALRDLLEGGENIETIDMSYVSQVDDIAKIIQARMIARAGCANLVKLSNRTRLTWFCNEANYRIAIVTEGGVLEVKNTSTHEKTFYADEQKWRASLPIYPTGVITVTPYMPVSVKKSSTPIPGDDVDKLIEISNRYKVYHTTSTAKSNQYRLKTADHTLTQCLATQPDDVSWAQNSVLKWEKICASHTEAENLYEPSIIHFRGKSRIFLIVDDVPKDVVVDFYNGENYITDKSGKRYKAFREIGNCLNSDGKPKLIVSYRNQMIPLSHLF